MADVLETDYWTWISSITSSIIKPDDKQNIPWVKKSLLYENFNYRFDLVDDISINLLEYTIKNKKQIAILIPETKISRTTLLLASLITSHWLDCQRNCFRDSKILYIGPQSIIRYEFKKLKLKIPRKNENRRPIVIGLDNFFRSRYIKNLELVQEETEFYGPYLPKILCNYSPSDPKSLIDQYTPSWVIINFEEGDKDVHWLSSLIESSKEKNIPLIALIQNPLSKCMPIIREKEINLYSWPPILSDNLEKTGSDNNGPSIIESIYRSYLYHKSYIKPIIVKTSYTSNFSMTYKCLLDAKRISSTEIGLTAVRIGFKYLRLLESLSIPFEFYEEECRHYWGMKSISKTREAFNQYIEAISHLYPDISYLLLEANSYLDKLYYALKYGETPKLWDVLIGLLDQTVDKNKLKFIIFHSKARQKLFELSILAKFNVTSSDLEKKRIIISCLEDLKILMKKKHVNEEFWTNSLNYNLLIESKIHLTLVGLPSPQYRPKLKSVLSQDEIDVILYSHLEKAFSSQMKEWNDALRIDFEMNARILSEINLENLPIIYPDKEDHTVMLDSQQINYQKEKPSLEDEICLDTETESVLKNIDSLMDDFPIDLDEEDYLEIKCDLDQELENQSNEILIDRVFEIVFEQGYKVLFSPNETLKVITSALKQGKMDVSVEDTNVSSVTIGDRILFIQGQKRQNLYDLLISRIHEYPSIELKLALVNRWHEELVTSYEKERMNNGLTSTKLLVELQERGSSISSAQTIRTWLYGSTVCPDDPKDLLRVGNFLNIDFVKKYYMEIYKAAQRLAGIHRGFSKRLSNWLLNQASGILHDDESVSEFIDEDLGIKLEDFKDSLMLLTVSSAKEKSGLYYTGNLAKLEVCD